MGIDLYFRFYYTSVSKLLYMCTSSYLFHFIIYLFIMLFSLFQHFNQLFFDSLALQELGFHITSIASPDSSPVHSNTDNMSSPFWCHLRWSLPQSFATPRISLVPSSSPQVLGLVPNTSTSFFLREWYLFFIYGTTYGGRFLMLCLLHKHFHPETNFLKKKIFCLT